MIQAQLAEKMANPTKGAITEVWELVATEDEVTEMSEFTEESYLKSLIGHHAGHEPSGDLVDVEVNLRADEVRRIGQDDPVEEPKWLEVTAEFATELPGANTEIDSGRNLFAPDADEVDFLPNVEVDAEQLQKEIEEEIEKLTQARGRARALQQGADRFSGTFTMPLTEAPIMAGDNSWVGDVETLECPNCETEFVEGEGIDNDNGVPYCSLDCINEEAND